MEKSNLAMQTHQYLGKEVRAMETDGELWFVAKDICDILEISDTRQVVEKLDDDEKNKGKVYQGDQFRDTWMVNESGMFQIVLSSYKPEAKAFKRWLTHEVLPAIRRTGKFTNEQAQAIELENKAIVRRLAEVNSLLAGNKGEAAALRKEKVQLEEKLKTNITNPAQALIPFKNE